MEISMDSLLKKINRRVIIYFSRKLIEENSGKNLSALDKVGMTNNLILIKEDGNLEPITYGARAVFLFQKEKNLKANLFELLKMKAKIEKNAMSFLLDNYFTELDTFIKFTYFVKANAQDEAVNYIPEIQNALDFQYRVLVEHKEELKEHFGKWKLNVDLERVFGYPPPNTKVHVDKKLLNNIAQNKTTKPETKKKKLPLLTEKEVDIYLLNTVFGLDLMILNNET